MKNPPAFAVRLLRVLLDDRDRDMIVGDLLEEYQERGRAADRWYLRQVSSFLVPAMVARFVPAAQVAFAASVFWLVLFTGISAWILHRPVFTPAPAIPAFFVCALGASVQASGTGRRAALGVAAGIFTGTLIAALAAVTLGISGLPHPPLGTLPLLPGVGALLGLIGGLFGSQFAPLSPLTRAQRSPAPAGLPDR